MVDVNETESEDEGPEVLPIQPATKRSNIAELLSDKPVGAHKTSSDNALKPFAEAPEPMQAQKSQIERIIRETQRRVDKEEARTKPMQPENHRYNWYPPIFAESVLSADALARAASNAGATAGSDDDEELDEVDEDFLINEYDPNGLEEYEGYDLTASPLAEKPAAQTMGAYDNIDVSVPSNDLAFAQRAPSPSDAALARSSSNSGSKPRANDHRDAPTTYFGNVDVTNAWPTAAAVAPNKAHSWASLLSPIPQDNQLMFQAPKATGYGAYTTGPFATTRRSSSPDPLASPPGFSAHPPSTYAPSSAQDPAVQSKTTEDPSAKLNIANLVNAYYAEESSRATKRKADAISMDEDLTQFESVRSHVPVTQETPLPDAQPRDIPMITETSISQGEPIEPTVSSITTTVTSETSPAEEPARKKVKTSSSSAGGIGKFLTGVAVGVVGVAAAFLATIPASVHEEVLMDLTGRR